MAKRVAYKTQVPEAEKEIEIITSGYNRFDAFETRKRIICLCIQLDGVKLSSKTISHLIHQDHPRQSKTAIKKREKAIQEECEFHSTTKEQWLTRTEEPNIFMLHDRYTKSEDPKWKKFVEEFAVITEEEIQAKKREQELLEQFERRMLEQQLQQQQQQQQQQQEQTVVEPPPNKEAQTNDQEATTEIQQETQPTNLINEQKYTCTHAP